MLKYYITVDHFEFRADSVRTLDDILDLYYAQHGTERRPVECYDDKEAALEAFSKEQSIAYHTEGYIHKLVVGSLVFLEEYDLDDDGEIFQIDTIGVAPFSEGSAAKFAS